MEPRYFYLVTPLAYTGKAQALTYHSNLVLTPGQIVAIPLGPRPILGVIARSVEQPTFKTRAVTKHLDIPPIPAELCDLADWLARYYAASPSSTWSTILPAGLNHNRRPPSQTKPLVPQGLPSASLTAEQTAALSTIRTSAQRIHLLQGVTGSGKTRVYLELTAEALAVGRSVIILVPEITLTPQVVGQFETAFGDKVLASHSKLTEAQRHRIWTQAMAAHQAGQARVIIGPRSCLFMPVHDLGLIVVDEAHETTYKQEQHPRYHAVTVAAWRTRRTSARLVLGSATPALSELYLANEGRIEHILMTQRANKLALPEAKIIDMRNKDLFKSSKFITQDIIDAIETTVAGNRQVLLYVNRRGSASSQVCGDCGYVNNCPNCNLPLTFHADLMRLICHHCNFRRPNPAVCPECNGANLRLLGGGTKRIEAEIERLFPSARLARLDRDSATLSHIKTVFRDLRRGEIDILIGTQMIAKGIDLPAIDLVGIINADTMLHLPDYTAAERTFQLLSQVSGRAGRGDRPGSVYIQTYTPDHPAITAATSGDYQGFADTELIQRQTLAYPPYVYMLKLSLAAPTREAAVAGAGQLATKLRAHQDISITGPAPAFIETQNDKYHWIITVKAKQRPILVEIAASLPSDLWTADLDPINLL